MGEEADPSSAAGVGPAARRGRQQGCGELGKGPPRLGHSWSPTQDSAAGGTWTAHGKRAVPGESRAQSEALAEHRELLRPPPRC